MSKLLLKLAVSAVTIAPLFPVVYAEKPKPVPPTCAIAQLSPHSNNAGDVASGIDGVTTGVTARALGKDRVLICGDDTKGAIAELKAAAEASGEENTPSPNRRESHIIKLFHMRDAATVAQVLHSAFPKLTVSAIGSDTLALGSPDGSDAELARHARRWISAIDVPRPEVTLNIWSVQVSGKDPNAVAASSTSVRQIVSEHNRGLQEALGRAHEYLARQTRSAGYYAPVFTDYVAERYVAESQPGLANRRALGACDDQKYCLGYQQAFHVAPNISSLLLNVLASRNAAANAFRLVDHLESRPASGAAKVASRSYSGATGGGAPLASIYGLPATATDCENVADRVYASRRAGAHDPAPVFPCLREALSDATEPVALARIRPAIAHFLFNQKFRLQYPDDFEPDNSSSAWMDTMAAPLLTAFNRDMGSFMRNIQKEVENEADGFSSNGMVTLSTISSIPSSVGTSTQSEFKLPPTFSLKDFLSAAVPPSPADGQTPAQAAAAKLPAFLAANLVPGVSIPLAAALSMDPTPAVASLGRNLTIIVTSNALPGASSAELNVNLTSQDEAPPTVQRGTESKTDTRSRVAKHNLQTVVRVDSMKLFELSSFGAELRRGGESIPILPVPFLEIPLVGGIVRWPVKPSVVYHRSFAIVSAVVLPTSADLASAVTPASDAVLRKLDPALKAKGPSGSGWKATYLIVAKRQDGVLESSKSVDVSTPSGADPVKLAWSPVGGDARYDLYRNSTGSSWDLIAEDLDVSHFEDDGGSGVRSGVTPPSPSGSTSALTRITPAAFLSAGVHGFHAARLECIRREAMGEALDGCDTWKLSNFPAEQ